MKALRRVVLGLMFVLAITLAVLSGHPPALLMVGANYAAKIVCSNVFLAHRNPKEVLETDVQAPGVGVMKLLHVSVDESQGTVHAGFLGFIGEGYAIHRNATGCTVLPDGQRPVEPSGIIPSASAKGAGATPADPPPPDEFDQAAIVPAYQAVLDDDALVGPGMRGALIIDHGRIVAERYGQGFTAKTPLLGWSMSKTVTAALVGLLVKDGKLKLEQSGFWPAGDGREAIKLSDLLSMSSGLRFNEAYGSVSDVTRMLYLEPDMALFARSQPLEHPVGSVWSYSSGTANIVARIVQDTGGPDFVIDRLFKPLGMSSAVMETDEYGTLVGSSYTYATARDWGRFGEFLVDDGVWHGERLLPEGYVAEMARPLEASKGEYGHGFVWLWGSDPVTPGKNPDAAFGIPPDTFYLSGHDGQTVAVIRSRQLVIVRLGLTPGALGYTTQKLLRAVLEVTRPQT